MKSISKKAFIYLFILVFFLSSSALAFSLKPKREKQKKTEEEIPGLTEVDRVHVPCFVKIAEGGELHIQIDTNRAAYLEMINQTNHASEFTLLRYRNGKLNEAYDEETAMFDKKEVRRMWDFNEKLQQKEPSLLVDEVVIKVNKGLVYAWIIQIGADRQDWYNHGGHRAGAGGHHTGAMADPNRPLTVQITGDNPFDDQAKGEFYLQSESEENSELVPFTVENGKTLTWDYPADKKVKNVEVRIDAGDGRAKFSLIQPPVPQKRAAKKTAVKKEVPKKYTPKPKTSQMPATPGVNAKPIVSPPVAKPEISAAGAILGGKVPLMEGAKVTKEVSLGPITQVDLEIPKSTEAVINFYKTTMANMGWQIGVTTVQGPKGMIQLQKEGSLLTMKSKEKGQKTIVNMVMMTQ